MTRQLSARVEASFRRQESLCYDDLLHPELTSKLIAELNFTIHELQAVTVELLGQNEELMTGCLALNEEIGRAHV